MTVLWWLCSIKLLFEYISTTVELMKQYVKLITAINSHNVEASIFTPLTPIIEPIDRVRQLEGHGKGSLVSCTRKLRSFMYIRYAIHLPVNHHQNNAYNADVYHKASLSVPYCLVTKPLDYLMPQRLTRLTVC